MTKLKIQRPPVAYPIIMEGLVSIMKRDGLTADQAAKREIERLKREGGVEHIPDIKTTAALLQQVDRQELLDFFDEEKP